MTDLEAFVRDEKRVERFLRSVRNNPSAVSEQKLLALLADRDAKLAAVRELENTTATSVGLFPEPSEHIDSLWEGDIQVGKFLLKLRAALKAVSHE